MYMYGWDEPYAEEECFECSEKENQLTDVAYWLRAVVDQLYGLEEFSAENLEHYLDELAHVAKIKLPQLQLAVSTIRENPTVERANRTTESNTSGLLNSWISANNQYLKSLTHKSLGV